MIAVAAFVPVLFFVVSCQDQVETTAAVADASYPKSVQQAIDRLKATNPNADFIVVPPSGPNLKDFEGKHADHISVIDGEYVFEAVSMLMIKAGEDANGNPQNYMILDYSSERSTRLPTEDEWKRASEVWEEKLDNSIDGEPIFTAVEQQASPKEGINAFTNSIKQKVRYPAEAKRLGLRGKVYVKFVIKKDGTATDFEIVKGVSKELDLEALRVLQAEIKGWNPAKQNGKLVHSQFVIPIQFGD